MTRFLQPWPADQVLCPGPILHLVGRDQGHHLHHEARLLLCEGWALGGAARWLGTFMGLEIPELLLHVVVVLGPGNVCGLKPVQVAPHLEGHRHVAVVGGKDFTWVDLCVLVISSACGIHLKLVPHLPVGLLLYQVLIHGLVAEEPRLLVLAKPQEGHLFGAAHLAHILALPASCPIQKAHLPVLALEVVHPCVGPGFQTCTDYNISLAKQITNMFDCQKQRCGN